MKKIFLFAFLLLGLGLFISSFKHVETTCNAPSNVHVVSSTSNSKTFDWDNCNCFSTGYEVWYLRKSDGYTSQAVTVTASEYTFTGLQAGAYTFYFRTKCGTQKSDIIGIDDIENG